MKVAYVLGSLNRGGTETLALNVCRNVFAVPQIELILLHRKDGELKSEFEKTGVVIKKLRHKPGLLLVSELRGFLAKNNIDLVHVHQPLDSLLLTIASAFKKIPVICSHHGFLPSGINRFLIQLSFKSCKANIFVSAHCADLYNKYAGLKARNGQVVYNGVSLQLQPGQNNIKSELGLDKDQILMGMVGNFYIDARDQFTVCKALKIMKDQGKPINFIFVGGRSSTSPELYDRCFSYCRDHDLKQVHFLGSRSDVQEILTGMDGFVYSTRYETFGLAVAEAMSAGLPCILNDHPAMMEISQNGTAARIYKSGDAHSLATEMGVMKGDEILRKQYSVKSREQVATNFDIKVHVQKLSNLYLSFATSQLN